MPTAVQICSNASLMLGGQSFSAFADTPPRAKLAQDLWPTIRDYLLRSHPWNCAVKRAVLDTADATAPDFDYSNRFALPEDCLRVLSVGLNGQAQDYELEGRFLLTDEAALYLRYIWQNTDPLTWDPLLVHAATVVMRSVFANPLTGSTSLEQLIEQVLAPILKKARAVDGQENPPETFGNESLFGAGF